jgi:hypothetical protein
MLGLHTGSLRSVLNRRFILSIRGDGGITLSTTYRKSKAQINNQIVDLGFFSALARRQTRVVSQAVINLLEVEGIQYA